MWYVLFYVNLLSDCFTGIIETYSACANTPCLNGGTCTIVGSSYQCTCPSGYYGAQCQSSSGKKYFFKMNFMFEFVFSQ
jgi:hypothetical protein